MKHGSRTLLVFLMITDIVASMEGICVSPLDPEITN